MSVTPPRGTSFSAGNGTTINLPHSTSLKNRKRTLKENFEQQTLPAWQPIFSAGRVSPAFLLLGLLFIPAGIAIWHVSTKVVEIAIPYTDCMNVHHSREYPDDFNRSCAEVINSTETALFKTCRCRVKFVIEKNLSAPVYIYYGLTNFFQNHRKYMSSRDDIQLKGGKHLGNAAKPETPAKACAPYDYVRDDEGEIIEPRQIYVPCGAIANSLFSDEIALYYNVSSGLNDNVTMLIDVPLNRTKIAWNSDQKYKFNNPDWFDEYANSSELQSKFVKPKAWRKELWELDPENPQNNGLNNEDLINWMRTAALPNFRKLFRIVNQHHEKRTEFRNGLPAGNYEIEIDYAFPVAGFEGTKTIIVSTTSILGNSSPFLGITYVIVGTLLIILAMFLFLIHMKNRDLNRKSAALEAQQLLLAQKRKSMSYYGT